MSAIDEKALADLLERLEAGCQRTGEGDNGEELFDVEGASDTMWDAALALRVLATPEAGTIEPVAGDETAWLIELRGSRPTWWSLHADEEPGWLPDANKALRFARKEDAEAYINDTGWTDAFASEHMWIGARVSRHPAPAQAPVDGEAVLVPRHPTPEMLGAWYRYKSGHHFLDETAPADTSDVGAYAAMLAAAPSARKEP